MKQNQKWKLIMIAQVCKKNKLFIKKPFDSHWMVF